MSPELGAGRTPGTWRWRSPAAWCRWARPRSAGALILVALVSLAVDALTGRSLGRRLTPERASQNVVSRRPAARPWPGARPAAGASRSDGRPPVTLLITANYDAGRAGLAYRPALRRAAARLRRATGRMGPGWLGWLALAFAWLLVTACCAPAAPAGP